MTFVSRRIYAVGGEDSATNSLREVEAFDPHTNRWVPCVSMIKRRASVAVASCNGFVYAIGGHDGSIVQKNLVRHDDGERYDPSCNQWTVITAFSRPKEGLSIVAVQNELYIAGGFDGKVLNDMERYDTETEKWRKVCKTRRPFVGDTRSLF